MMSIGVAFASRCLLVLLFLPFSALDKLLNFGQAVDQAEAAGPNPILARGLIGIGFGIEVLMSLAILSGVADRAAATVLAAYCVATAILWKQFWKTPDFKLRGVSRGRDVFWDFLKNLALAGGFLMLASGTNAAGVRSFLDAPLASSHPYRLVASPGDSS
jgi:putative oxidoreductase